MDGIADTVVVVGEILGEQLVGVLDCAEQYVNRLVALFLEDLLGVNLPRGAEIQELELLAILLDE